MCSYMPFFPLENGTLVPSLDMLQKGVKIRRKYFQYSEGSNSVSSALMENYVKVREIYELFAIPTVVVVLYLS